MQPDWFVPRAWRWTRTLEAEVEGRREADHVHIHSCLFSTPGFNVSRPRSKFLLVKLWLAELTCAVVLVWRTLVSTTLAAQSPRCLACVNTTLGHLPLLTTCQTLSPRQKHAARMSGRNRRDELPRSNTRPRHEPGKLNRALRGHDLQVRSAIRPAPRPDCEVEARWMLSGGYEDMRSNGSASGNREVGYTLLFSLSTWFLDGRPFSKDVVVPCSVRGRSPALGVRCRGIWCCRCLGE